MGVLGRLGQFAVKIAESVVGTIVGMVNGVIDLINKAIGLANKVPGINITRSDESSSRCHRSAERLQHPDAARATYKTEPPQASPEA
jgi:hypothetical protein